MKKYTIDLSNIVDFWDMRELKTKDVGTAYVIRELWEDDENRYIFTKEEVMQQFPQFEDSFDRLVEQGIITEVK